jgi:cysteine desulfurase family protein
MEAALREGGGNPGRSAHGLARAAAATLAETRSLLATLFHAPDARRFIFTPNATAALNLALKGLLKPGDRVVTDTLEHNSVARPLEALAARGVLVEKLPASPESGLDPGRLEEALSRPARLVVLCHASNVSGTLNPVAELGALCKARGVPFLLDAAQTAGSIPIDLSTLPVDLLAFPGHKGLLGPQGTGGLWIGPGLELEPLVEGGTGSESRSLLQPAALPERHESGTPNTPGIAGLGAALRWLLERGVGAMGELESRLAARLVDGLAALPGIRVYGPPPGKPRASVVSVNVSGLDASDVAEILDASFDVAVRAGLHCAPDAHACLGTLGVPWVREVGTVRLSPGVFTTEAEVDGAVYALAEIAREARGAG